MELMTCSSVDGEKLPHSVSSGCRFVGRRCGWRTSVCGSVKWAPEPLGLGAAAQSPALAPYRSPAPRGVGGRRLERRPGWHAGPSAPRGLRRGRIARAAQESWLGRRAFPAGGSARPRGRGGGETLRCARPAGSMQPLLCALAGLALLRAAGEWGPGPGVGGQGWNRAGGRAESCRSGDGPGREG